MFRIGDDWKEQGVEDMDPKILPQIRLRDPLLTNSFVKGKFTTYKIIIETEHHAFHLRHSCIRRRYSEIRWLNDILDSHHKQVKLPQVPSKKIWSERFNTTFVNERMNEIEVYLNALLQIDTILSDTALHLFLQTDLTTEEIEGFVKGTVPEDLINEAWANNGHIHTPNELGTFLSIATPRVIEMDDEDEMLAALPKKVDSSSLDPDSPTKTSPLELAPDTVWFSNGSKSKTISTDSASALVLEASEGVPKNIDLNECDDSDPASIDNSGENVSLDSNSRDNSPACIESVTGSASSDLSR